MAAPSSFGRLNITPTQQRYAILGVGGALLLGVAYITMSEAPIDQQRLAAQRLRPQTTTLTGANVVDLTIEDLAQEQRANQREVERLQDDLARMNQFLQDRLGLITEQVRNVGDVRQTAISEVERRRQAEIEELRKKNQELAGVIETLNRRVEGISTGAVPVPAAPGVSAAAGGAADRRPPGQMTVVDPGQRQRLQDQQAFTPQDLFGGPATQASGANRGAPVGAAPEARDRAQAARQAPAAVRPVSIRRGEDAGAGALATQPVLQLATGSIIRATLLSGVDAPTSGTAQGNPLPMLLRIDREALMPNRFRADVRDCFLIISGFGNLATGRVHARGERISCIMDNGVPVEGPIAGYATAEDGKVGFPGRVVHKAGSALAAAALAGFASGISEAFRVDIVPVVQTVPGGGTPTTQRRFAGVESIGSAAAAGAGSALELLAQFYIDLAEQQLPVVEVNAGRSVEFIVTQALSLSPSPAGNPAAAPQVAQQTVRRIQ